MLKPKALAPYPVPPGELPKGVERFTPEGFVPQYGRWRETIDLILRNLPDENGGCIRSLWWASLWSHKRFVKTFNNRPPFFPIFRIFRWLSGGRTKPNFGCLRPCPEPTHLVIRLHRKPDMDHCQKGSFGAWFHGLLTGEALVQHAGFHKGQPVHNAFSGNTRGLACSWRSVMLVQASVC